MGGRKLAIKAKHRDRVEGAEALRRVYPEVGRVDTVHDIKELIRAIERDRIPRDLKRKRLQFMYSLTFSRGFKKQFKGSIRAARRLLKNAYQRYLKNPAPEGVKEPASSFRYLVFDRKNRLVSRSRTLTALARRIKSLVWEHGYIKVWDRWHGRWLNPVEVLEKRRLMSRG